MKYKILVPNAENGLFYFTKERLEELLNETYNDGYEDGKKVGHITYIPYPQLNNPNTTPNNPLNPYITWLGPNDVPPNLSTSDNSYYSTTTTKGTNTNK